MATRLHDSRADVLEHLPIHDWAGPFPAEITAPATDALEGGKVLYAPELRFALSDSERRFLAPSYLDGKSKNISFDPATGKLTGTLCASADRDDLTAMMRRFFTQAGSLIGTLCPASSDFWRPGRTSFRPAEISGRPSSWRKDDTRLHVDAFPSRPVRGQRILRVFANVNASTPRVWRVGEPFPDAARTLLPRVRPPFPGSRALLSLLGITQGGRTLYDHYMLGLHDAMKADSRYQATAPQAEIAFPPGVVWACFTDSVSHAAMSGQHVFEQTFYLPADAMHDPSRSPLRVLESLLGKPLV